MPGRQRFESRRRQWREETDATKVGLICDDLDELEVRVAEDVSAIRRSVTEDVSAIRRRVEESDARNQASNATVKKQQWAIMLLIIAGMVSVIGALVVRV